MMCESPVDATWKAAAAAAAAACRCPPCGCAIGEFSLGQPTDGVVQQVIVRVAIEGRVVPGGRALHELSAARESH